ncbi:caspase-1-like [Vespula squamosa]|uniref:Caspase-1-like n=1 Tax=Vespula squamosa TaxID=30214 RepID=A0ABD2BNP8_VESSQ
MVTKVIKIGVIRDSELCFNVLYDTLSGLNIIFSIVFFNFWLTSYVLRYLISKTTSNKMFRSSDIEEVSEDTSADNIKTELIDENLSQFVYKEDNESLNFISTTKSADVVDSNTFKSSDDYYEASNVPTTISTVGIDDPLYNMNYDNRGKCVIFNHTVFDEDLNKRTGTDIDAMRINDVFTKLGFEVVRYDDLIYTDLRDTISTLSSEDHSNSDCICIFVLTHGMSDNLIYAKDVPYNANYIWKPFSADLCPSLAGKPKLFFFQACKGKRYQESFEFRCNADFTDSTTIYTIPTHADFLIAYSTIEGFYSFRNEEKGSCYVQYLCDTLEEYADTKDLLNILTITARKVAIKFTSSNKKYLESHNKKQIPSVTSMLTRDLYLKKKLTMNQNQTK